MHGRLSGKIRLVAMIAALSALMGCATFNRFQRDGQLRLKGLHQPVRVVRDGKGMAYIYARDMDDALRAQGFVAAQDRLFQMELTRRVACGRISELIGDKGIAFDTRMRTLGFYRNARRHAALLGPGPRRFLESYLAGVNAYIASRHDTYPLEFRLSGIAPTPWTTADALAILYYMSWNSSANLDSEIVMQALLDRLGPERVKALLPLNIDPDDPRTANPAAVDPQVPRLTADLFDPAKWSAFLKPGPLAIGSNNWVVGPGKTPGKKPILANDPHLDARILPGPWYPSALITPHHRIVGVGIAGLPGMVIFRSDHVAVGVTNAYSDVQDLYIETVDPADPTHYLEGSVSRPFELIRETLRIKDSHAKGGFREQPIVIRCTRRGPVISDAIDDFAKNVVVTLRWAPYETMGPEIGLDRVLTADSAEAVHRDLTHFNWIALNFVFADTQGNIGWVTSGKIPIRSAVDGAFPVRVTDSADNWHGYIPYDAMPQVMNPKKGWIATCNHRTVGADYPYYLSSYFAASYRYDRIKQLLSRVTPVDAGDEWQFQRDTKNLLAVAVAPIMEHALARDPKTRPLAAVLAAWNCHDDADAAGPTVFQAVYRHFAQRVFEDELGQPLTDRYLEVRYVWQERLEAMVKANDSPWFDDVRTPDRIETRDDDFVAAGKDALAELDPTLGSDPADWRWGKVHTIEFVSPIRSSGFGKGILGGGKYPFPGSCETLYRGIYDFNNPFRVTISASLRMVADLSDPDKVLAVLPGGVTARVFDPHTTDQIPAFIHGNKRYWWFSDTAITAHEKDRLILAP